MTSPVYPLEALRRRGTSTPTVTTASSSTSSSGAGAIGSFGTGSGRGSSGGDLHSHHNHLPLGVDPARLEEHLLPADFPRAFPGPPPVPDLTAFRALPDWRRAELKRRAGLF
ncbi:hypothetical protein HK405_000664 [Cladochytrium tenue]|nr:hypothetical protein HK405_000664 [Cladochytrium tenue]